MCGIVGRLDPAGKTPSDLAALLRMLQQIRHRGPDSFGAYLDEHVSLGSARLSIVDLDGGVQPVHNEDESVWIVFNGEIFNHVELREELRARGHRFYTRTDTEVIVHLYEERGDRCVEALNGQFAFAIWDRRTRELLLGRDRLGVRPLFYTEVDGVLLFASEIKSLFVDPRVTRELDPRALDQIFTCWAPLPGQTAFRGVRELPPGHTATVRRGGLARRRYWQLAFPEDGGDRGVSEADYVARARGLLADATRLRLRADVPVGAYLSGGLDSSAIAAIARSLDLGPLHTFSIAFQDASFDERQYQERMARHLGVEHHEIRCADGDIGRVFPEVVKHAEVPVLRTAPAPMFLLSSLVHDAGFKVVLTGEGADEFFAGYDIFKEDRIRRFWARDPDSRLRPRLLRRLYADVRGLRDTEPGYLAAFFGRGLAETDRKGYSHLVRWRGTSGLKRLFAEGVRAALTGTDAEREIEDALDDRLLGWHPLGRAQYIEATLFLSQYLLSSQGDRVAMAHSVEGRFPFLDHRMVEFCATVPPRLRLRGLNEKYLLKRAVEDLVPREIRQRAKRPYRAPIRRAFFGDEAPEYVADLLSPRAIARGGLFNPIAVGRLVEKARQAPHLGEMDAMAIVGVISTQLLHHLFVEAFASWSSADVAVPSLVVDRRPAPSGRPGGVPNRS